MVFGSEPDKTDSSGPSTNVSLNIRGISKELQAQVRSSIDEIAHMPVAELPRYLLTIQKNAKTSLQALGFYEATTSVGQSTYKQNTAIQLRIKPGRPVRIKAVNVLIDGAANDDSEFTKSILKLPLVTGNIFNHGDYEQSKDIIFGNAHNLGYFDAAFTRTQVLVTRKEHHAEIFLEFNSKDRYRITDVRYTADLFNSKFLERWQPFKADVPYRASYVRELTQRLQNSGYFKSVKIKPAFEQSVGTSIPLIADLVPASENIVSVGVGYATDSGPRVKGTWLRPHTNSLGHKFKAGVSLSELRNELSFGYSVPHYKHPNTGSYTLDLGLSNHRTDDTYSQLRTMDIGDHRTTRDHWTRDIFLRWENESFRVGDSNDTINLLLPGLGISKTKSTGGLKPIKGTYFSFKVLGGSSKLLSDITMMRTTASIKILNSWNQNHYLIAGADLGILTTPDFQRVPTSHRFFAGGDNSVRGFSYQSISPLNDSNEAIGGQFLTTASLEYNYYFRDRWAVAAFVDTGRAFIDFDDRYRVGIGTGVRWLSPLGPLRIDIGYGISEEKKPLRLHLAIGPQL